MDIAKVFDIQVEDLFSFIDEMWNSKLQFESEIGLKYNQSFYKKIYLVSRLENISIYGA